MAVEVAGEEEWLGEEGWLGTELLQGHRGGEGEGRGGVTEAASSGDLQTVPPLSTKGGHGGREKDFQGQVCGGRERIWEGIDSHQRD